MPQHGRLWECRSMRNWQGSETSSTRKPLLRRTYRNAVQEAHASWVVSGHSHWSLLQVAVTRARWRLASLRVVNRSGSNAAPVESASEVLQPRQRQHSVVDVTRRPHALRKRARARPDGLQDVRLVDGLAPHLRFATEQQRLLRWVAHVGQWLVVVCQSGRLGSSQRADVSSRLTEVLPCKGQMIQVP